MSIPPSGEPIKMSLRQKTPTKMTPEVLKEQLAIVGLDCDELTDEFLQESINNVTSQLFPGKVQCYKIENHSSPTATNNPDPNWEWTDDDPTALNYELYLSTIVVPEHFDWLLSNSPGNQFFGKQSENVAEGEKDNAQAIEDMFVECAMVASATVDEGIDENDMESSLTNAIAPLSDDSISDYKVPENDGDPWPSMVMMLVQNYDPNTGYADGIGILSYRWTMTIEDYKRKEKDGGDTHNTYMKVIASSVLYPGLSGICLMCNHYNSVVNHFEIDDQLPNCRDRAGCPDE